MRWPRTHIVPSLPFVNRRIRARPEERSRSVEHCHDQKSERRLSSRVDEGQEPRRSLQIARGSKEAAACGGILQAPKDLDYTHKRKRNWHWRGERRRIVSE